MYAAILAAHSIFISTRQSGLFLSLFFPQYHICNFQGFKRELCLVSRHHDTGFLCDPVELPVFQQKEGPTQQGGFRRLTLQQIPAPQAEPCAYCHSQSTPQESTKTCLHLGPGWLVVRIGCSVLLCFPKNAKFYRCLSQACHLSISCPLLRKCNALELFNYV